MASAEENSECGTSPPTSSAATASTKKVTPASAALSPLSILERAAKAHPAFKLLWGILAIAMVVSIVTIYLDLVVALFGGLIVFFFLMVLYVGLDETAQSDSKDPATAPKVQVQTLRLFLAWSSGVLMVVTLLALLSSAFLDFPAPLRNKIFSLPVKASELPNTPPDKGDVEPILLSPNRLAVIQTTLEGKIVTDAKIRELFVRRSIPVESVLLHIHRVEKKIKSIEISPLVGAYALHLCDVNEGDPDFQSVLGALELGE